MACVEGRADDGTLVRVWATRGKEELGRFALENSVAALRYMNDYFGIPYPLAKMDHIAVPDFAAGAMENWGAITYRETASAVRPGELRSAGEAADTGSRCARDGAHVVRRPRNDGVVGRPLAQRVVRILDGRQDGRPPLPRMGDVDAVRLPRHECCTGAGRPAQLPPHRGERGRPCGDTGAVRRHQLQQGRLRPSHAGGLRRPRDVPQGTARVPEQSCLRQRSWRAPVGRDQHGGGSRGPSDSASRSFR